MQPILWNLAANHRFHKTKPLNLVGQSIYVELQELQLVAIQENQVREVPTETWLEFRFEVPKSEMN